MRGLLGWILLVSVIASAGLASHAAPSPVWSNWADREGGLAYEPDGARASAALERLGDAHLHMPRHRLCVRVLSTDRPCAYCWPDGTLFVTDGLLRLLDDDELAGALRTRSGTSPAARRGFEALRSRAPAGRTARSAPMPRGVRCWNQPGCRRISWPAPWSRCATTRERRRRSAPRFRSAFKSSSEAALPTGSRPAFPPIDSRSHPPTSQDRELPKVTPCTRTSTPSRRQGGCCRRCEAGRSRQLSCWKGTWRASPDMTRR